MADRYISNDQARAGLQRTSAGPAFQDVPPPSEAFLRAVRTCFTGSNGEPRGISNTGVLCYRNASLSMLLRSQRFLSFIRNWHLHEHILPNLQDVHSDKHIKSVTTGHIGITGAVANRIQRFENHDWLTHLNDIARGLESRPIAGPMPNDTLLNTTEDQRIESAVSKFWRTFCDPTAGQNVSNTLQNSFWINNNKKVTEQQDAQEFLIYIMESIAAQLAHYAQNSPVTYQQDLFKSLIHVRQAERLYCEGCSFKVRRRRAPLSDVNCLQIRFGNEYWNRDSQALRTPENLQSRLFNEFRDTLDIDCPRCKKKGQLRKHLTMQTTPEILLICIVRTMFGQYPNGQYGPKKNLQAVSIPEILDVTDFLEPSKFGSDSVVKYRLSGVTSHSGPGTNLGHYVSYVRGGVPNDQWYELNDDTVAARELADFDDTFPDGISSKDFRRRFTPYLLLYELDTKLSWMSDGRDIMNIGEGDNRDEQPTSYFPEEQKAMNKPATDLLDGDEWQYLNSMENETTHPKAVLNVAVEIDDEIFKLPRTFIEHFDPGEPRVVEIKASIESPWNRTNAEDRRTLDLAKAYVDAEMERRRRYRGRHLRNARLQKTKDWNSRWKRKT